MHITGQTKEIHDEEEHISTVWIINRSFKDTYTRHSGKDVVDFVPGIYNDYTLVV